MSPDSARSTIISVIVFVIGVAAIGAAIVFWREKEPAVIVNSVNPTTSGSSVKTYSAEPAFSIDREKTYFANFETSQGNFKVELFTKNAPRTVNNFVFLTKDGYYDGVKVHRIVRNFIIQSGSRLSMDNDPNNDGVGTPGYKFADEMNWDSLLLTEAQKANLTKVGFSSISTVQSVSLDKYGLAMANSGPNTNGSQFFFATAGADDASIGNLQGRHTVFGKVISGTEVIDAMNSATLVNENSSAPRPAKEIVISKISITE